MPPGMPLGTGAGGPGYPLFLFWEAAGCVAVWTLHEVVADVCGFDPFDFSARTASGVARSMCWAASSAYVPAVREWLFVVIRV